mmetsp:Transcript_29553/g.48765  ORF Transcript_29553/g.48765 Transcript_29553/m.48765 type:complete len:90 (+) Transcript_29553:125-394(+)|eukprot:CAMPEP_0119003716 /NCGR_PEP_ID=MMETSP1176-20130426/729_1 /TAXON_ID=265551 /ORGANISM="Synedropsis recta cf, Strain CCMP1620" /LENGTH=89 /DNA_ID=CAMNT_0006955341 /DNA_START=107 /DNA_END=376 /DNA_ORIENTATION=+
MAPKFQKGPDLKRFMDKKLKFSVNGNRTIVGTLRGFDAFLNVALEEAEHDGKYLGTIVIRGNSIIKFEGIERVYAAAAPTAAAPPVAAS